MQEIVLALIDKLNSSVFILLGIFGILLRNHVLNEKKLPIADVDKHAREL